MKRSIRFLGMAIPAWVIVTILSAVVVLAAWFFVIKPFTVEITSGSGLADSDISLWGWDKSVNTDVAPAGLSCDFVGGAATMIDATPGDICEYFVQASNAHASLTVYIAPVDGPDIGSLAPEFVLADLACGNSIAPAGTGTPRFTLEMTDQGQPETTYGPFNLDFNFDVNVPTCP